MSGFAIVGIILGGGIASVILSLVITEFLISGDSDISGLWPDDIYRWIRDKKKASPKERQPEVGTIRIVEKMRDDESVYYIAEEYGWRGGEYARHLTWAEMQFGERHKAPNGYYFGVLMKFDTPEEAQQRANDEVSRYRAEDAARLKQERRRNYANVMGEFKP